MTTKTILTTTQIQAIREENSIKHTAELMTFSFARAIEQAILQSPEIQELRKEVEGLYKGDPRNILADTGHTEADQIIRRLTSSDPDFDDCTDAAVLIRRLVLGEIKGPDDFATWKDAAVAERAARSAAKPNPEIVAMAREGLSVYAGPNMNENKVCAELVRVSQAINAAMEQQK